MYDLPTAEVQSSPLHTFFNVPDYILNAPHANSMTAMLHTKQWNVNRVHVNALTHYGNNGIRCSTLVCPSLYS